MTDNQYHIAEITSLNDEQKSTCSAVFVPTDDIAFFKVEMPKVARSKWQQLVPWLLEDKLLTSADDVHIAFGERDSDGLLNVAVVATTIIEQWQKVINDNEIEANHCIPDIFNLPYVAGKWVVSFLGGHGLVRSGLYEGFSGSQTWVESIIATQPNQAIDIYCDEPSNSNSYLPLSDLKPSESPVSINIFQGRYKPATSRDNYALKAWLPLVLAPIFLVLLFITNMLVESYQFNQTAQSYQQSGARDFQRLFDAEYEGEANGLRQEVEYLQRFSQHKSQQYSGGLNGLLLSLDTLLSRCSRCNLVSIEADEAKTELVFESVGVELENKIAKLKGVAVKSAKIDGNTVLSISKQEVNK